MAHIISGIIVLAMAATLAYYWLRLVRVPRRLAGQPGESRKRTLTVVQATDSTNKSVAGMVDISGTVASPPTLEAPLTGRPCSVWELTLYVAQYTDEGIGWVPRWVTGRGGDLVLEYDVRRDVAHDGRPRPTVQALGGPGRVEVPGDRIVVPFPSRPESPMPGLALTAGGAEVRPVDIELLRRLGLPAEILAAVVAKPDSFRVAEGLVARGDFLRLNQGPLTSPAPGPDPSQPFSVIPVSQEYFMAAGRGCFGPVLLIVAIVLGLLGVALLLG